MSAGDVAIDVLLAVGVACELVCCLGLLLARDVFDRLHYVGAASAVGPLFIGAALLLTEPLTGAGVKTILTVVVLVLVNPAVTNATARLGRLKRVGQVESLPEERP